MEVGLNWHERVEAILLTYLYISGKLSVGARPRTHFGSVDDAANVPFIPTIIFSLSGIMSSISQHTQSLVMNCRETPFRSIA